MRVFCGTNITNYTNESNRSNLNNLNFLNFLNFLNNRNILNNRNFSNNQKKGALTSNAPTMIDIDTPFGRLHFPVFEGLD